MIYSKRERLGNLLIALVCAFVMLHSIKTLGAVDTQSEQLNTNVIQMEVQQ